MAKRFCGQCKHMNECYEGSTKIINLMHEGFEYIGNPNDYMECMDCPACPEFEELKIE